MLTVLGMSIKDATSAYLRLYESALRANTRTPEERARVLKDALEKILDNNIGEDGNPSLKLSGMKLREVEKLIPGCKLCVLYPSSATSP